MDFPAGKTILLIVLFALAGAVGMALRPWSHAKASQTLWVFDPVHRDTYTQASATQPSLVDQHAARTGRTVQVQLMPSRALDARLLSLILSDSKGKEVPDLVEIEIGSVGKYFRNSSASTGLLPLEHFIAADPAAKDLLPQRLATWSHAGHIYGIPRDVHPVTITYREDLFSQAGVDLAACHTWPDFQAACLRFQRYWSSRGQPRTAMQLSRWNASDLMIFLQQQRINLLTSNGEPDFSDPRIAQTIAFYVRLVSGESAIGGAVSQSMAELDLAEGHTAALFTPDWRVPYLKAHPSLAGKLRMMPLPRFSQSDAPTCSWGGTMIAIPAQAADPAASWQLLHDLQLTPAALAAREAHGSVLPALQDAWQSIKSAEARSPDPFFSRQPVMSLYADLAAQLPPQRSGPYASAATQALSAVLADAQSHCAANPQSDLPAYCRERLARSQASLVRLLDFAEGRP